MNDPVVVGARARLTVADVVAVARTPVRVHVDPGAVDRLAAAQLRADEVAATRSVYGRGTGVGANRDQAVDDQEAAAARLLASHATGLGPARSLERVRALLVVRLQQVVAGGSGIAPAVATGLARLLEPGAEPEVPDSGSIGTGDLSALATVARALADRGGALGPGDALALLSSNAGALGDAALALHDLDELARAMVVAAALTCVAARGNLEAFGPAAEAATPFAGARWVCRTVSGLVPSVEAARIQDPFALRTLPQVHGPWVDALDAAAEVVERLAAATSENPLFGEWGVAHHGGFHAAYAAQALDAVVLAAAQAAQLGMSRTAMLMDPELTGLPAFLADGTAGASGAMLLEYAAAAALGDLRALATAASLQSVSVSRGLEEDASYAALAARQALAAAEPLRVVVACELVAARRGLLHRPVALPATLAAAVDLLGGVGSDLADRDLSDDLAAARAVIPDLAVLVTR